jgi:hypothetical protein
MKKCKLSEGICSYSLRKPIGMLRYLATLLISGVLMSNAAYGNDDPVVFYQQQSITGRVIDSQTNEGMPGVNIQVKGTTQGTSTDADGRYTI